MPRHRDIVVGCFVSLHDIYLPIKKAYLFNSSLSSRSCVRLLLDLRAAFSSVSKDHSQGHKSKATIVIVVSKQFDKVLVEQNHCQGLATVKANYTPSVSCHATLSRATYHRPILTRPVTIDPTSKFPGVEVADGCDNGLRGLRSGD